MTQFRNIEFNGKDNLDKISHAVCSMAVDVDAKAIAVCSVSGKTAMMVSRFRTPVDIVGLTTDHKIWRRLSMSWGVTPILVDEFPNMEVMFYFAKMKVEESLKLAKGSNIIITGGPVSRGGGNTNTIKIETICSVHPSAARNRRALFCPWSPRKSAKDCPISPPENPRKIW